MNFRGRIVETAKAVSPFVQIAVGAVLMTVALYQFLGRKPPAEWVQPMYVIFALGLGSFVAAVVFAFRFYRDKATVAAAEATGRLSTERLGFVTRRINTILAIDSEHCVFLYRNPKASKEMLQEKFAGYISDTLSQISELFKSYTGKDCAACVKLLNLSSEIRTFVDPDKVKGGAELPFVYTMARDPFSRTHRAHVDSKKGLDIYRYDFNTGLAKAMEVDNKGYWSGNDLKALGPEYRNVNGEWPNFYNAACIAVLRTPHTDTINQALGFLCVDNMKGGFDNDVCREIMEILANIVYYTLWMYISRIENFRGETS